MSLPAHNYGDTKLVALEYLACICRTSQQKEEFDFSHKSKLITKPCLFHVRFITSTILALADEYGMTMRGRTKHAPSVGWLDDVRLYLP